MSDPSSTDKRRKRTPAYLSQTAFAEHLDISRITVWRWLQTGKLRCIRLTPSLVRIPLSEVERLALQPADKRSSPRKRSKRPGAEQQDDGGDPTETD